jgi:subtilisin-like proprotein convertase family protein
VKRNTSTLLLASLLALAVGRLEAQVAETVTFNNLNKAIPDGNAAGLSDVHVVNSSIVNLASLRVRLRIAGQFNGDLYCYVRHIQNGVTNFCVLLNRAGRATANTAGYADAGVDVLLDDNATSGDIHVYGLATNLPAGTSLSSGWRPDGRRVDPDLVLDTTPRTATLSGFNGADASGEWTLYVADLASGGTNSLVSWELNFNGIARPAVTWSTPADITYGTSLGAGQLNASSPVPGSFSYSPSAGTVLNAGSNQVLSVTFTPTDLTSYVPVTTNVLLNVQPKALTVTAYNTNKLYGAAVPVLKAGYSGFVNGDTSASLTSQASLSTTATPSSPVGPYAITASGASGSNYTIGYVPGTLTITKASLTGSLASSANPALPSQLVTFTLNLSAVPPGAGTPGGTVQFRIDGTAAGGPVALSGGVASYTTSALAHGTHSVSAEYAGDGNFTGATNALPTPQLVNTPPVAGPDTITRTGTNGTKVSVTTLLGNDTDADGDSLTFLAVSSPGVSGGTVVSNGGWIYYTPPPGSTNTDSFTYAIGDGFGAPVTGVVTVNVLTDNGPSPNLTITALGGSAYNIRGDGIPGRTYRIQYSNSPNGGWQELGSATADAFGIFQLTDANGSPQRFYRSVYP